MDRRRSCSRSEGHITDRVCTHALWIAANPFGIDEESLISHKQICHSPCLSGVNLMPEPQPQDHPPRLILPRCRRDSYSFFRQNRKTISPVTIDIMQSASSEVGLTDLINETSLTSSSSPKPSFLTTQSISDVALLRRKL